MILLWLKKSFHIILTCNECNIRWYCHRWPPSDHLLRVDLCSIISIKDGGKFLMAPIVVYGSHSLDRIMSCCMYYLADCNEMTLIDQFPADSAFQKVNRREDSIVILGTKSGPRKGLVWRSDCLVFGEWVSHRLLLHVVESWWKVHQGDPARLEFFLSLQGWGN